MKTRFLTLAAVAAGLILAGVSAAIAAPGSPGEPSPGAGLPPFMEEEANLPPGLESRLELPHGLAKKTGEWTPPGQPKKEGESTPPGKAKSEGWLPPGHARKGTMPTGLERLWKIPSGWLGPTP